MKYSGNVIAKSEATKQSRLLRNDLGFTFIEVMVAMLIFVIAVVVSIDIVKGAVRATRESKDMSVATWLLQNTMTELETKLETEGIDKGCDRKKEARFEAPFDRFSWVTHCTEIDFSLSETAAQMNKKEEDSNEPAKENVIQKMILQIASQYITKSLRELHSEVSWMQGKTKRVISATTHFARYDQPFAVPALGGAASP